ncbi:uncharacterized protein [Phyllobates terribilis]|uniref:uncharacterized protein n=1 Tax=Phyllobates terribilis TaxID=111132 RepID=UPI003CCB3E13
MSLSVKDDSIHIREVWSHNLEEEFALIGDIVDNYPYVAMDTEFPGVVVQPVGNFRSVTNYNYKTLKDNVDMLKLIQLGLTFSDEMGNLPTCGTNKYCVWQFNFRDAYDFGYLLKLLICRSLPETQIEFLNLIKIYLPTIYDIKHLMEFCNNLHGGLNKLAKLLDVKRVGICHQAGSDSLLTCCTFMKLKNTFFKSSFQKHVGVLYGLVSCLSIFSHDFVIAQIIFCYRLIVVHYKIMKEVENRYFLLGVTMIKSRTMNIYIDKLQKRESFLSFLKRDSPLISTEGVRSEHLTRSQKTRPPETSTA